MTPRQTIVAHRHRIVAEGLASALARHVAMVRIVVTTTEDETERIAQPMDAVALDAGFERARPTLERLRRAGVRVVPIGAPLDDGAAVPLDAPIAELARALLPTAARRERAGGTLSPREREILSLIADGLVAKQVAQRLAISVKTVEHHKHRIFCKLGVPNQAAAIRSALVDGLV